MPTYLSGALWQYTLEFEKTLVGESDEYRACPIFLENLNLGDIFWDNIDDITGYNIGFINPSNSQKLPKYVDYIDKVSKKGLVWVNSPVDTTHNKSVYMQLGQCPVDENSSETFTLANVVNRWTMDEGSGDIIDKVGTNDLSASNLIYNTTGQVYKAVTQDGTSSMVNASVLSYERSDSFSAFSVHKRSSIGVNAGILSRREPSLDTRGWEWRYRSDNKIDIALVSAITGTNYIVVNTSNAIANTDMVMRHLSYNGSSQASGIVLGTNGVQDADTDSTNNLSGTIVTSTMGRIAINRSGDVLEGEVDENQVYNVVKSVNYFKGMYESIFNNGSFVTLTSFLSMYEQQGMTWIPGF